ncbi:MlaC/ttg2D family ABC transporter substrate-binding protein [Ottowia thiooxydans]|uniref:MlaC/ttg2D family ABC transporter substrate-binding protein n=1 Tax=Ottowia thiooxydans TaxID=219182 RepID=UPI0003FCE40B|nr:ABC transporter substrate-binding protein [Ottowia thiooxydans]
MNQPFRRSFLKCSAVLVGALTLASAAPWVHAADEAPDAMIRRLSAEVLDTIRSDKSLQDGNVARVMAVVDSKIMPNVNFRRMTASATGPGWRKATPEQQQKLQQEFKTLLVRTYAGALRQVSDQAIEVRPMRSTDSDKEVLVRTLVKGKGEPVQLDYRLEKTPGQGAGWKIYDLNVAGIWLVDTYRPQFAQQINANGIDGLVASLVERNQANASTKN